jgi:excisionase family DNA binding protein
METVDLTLALRPEKAAAAIGVSRSKIYELLAAGRLSSIRIDGVRVIPIEALRKLLSETAR